MMIPIGGSVELFAKSTIDWTATISAKQEILSATATGKGGIANNVAFGNGALFSNTTGFVNTAIGDSSAYSKTTGNSNIAIGSNALYFNTSGGSNVAIGPNAMTSENIGTGNIAIGGGSLNSTTFGSYNIGLGASSRTATSGDDYSIVIGYQAIGNGSNTTTIGSSTNYGTYLFGSTIQEITPTTNTLGFGGNVRTLKQGAGTRNIREYNDTSDGFSGIPTSITEFSSSFNAKFNSFTNTWTKDRSNAGDHASLERLNESFQKEMWFSDGTTPGSAIAWVKKSSFDLATGNYTIAGSINPASGVVGVTTNSNATTGYVGEYISSQVAVASAVALTTATPANVTSISLTAGDWDVDGVIDLNLSGATTTDWTSGISTTTGAFGGQDTLVVQPLILTTATAAYGLQAPRTQNQHRSNDNGLFSGEGDILGGNGWGIRHIVRSARSITMRFYDILITDQSRRSHQNWWERYAFFQLQKWNDYTGRTECRMGHSGCNCGNP